MTSNIKKEIFLKDYKTPSYWIENVYLEIDLSSFPAKVTSALDLVKNETNNSSELILNGVDLNLKEIYVDGEILSADYYELGKESLKLVNLPSKCELKTVVEISPDKNFTGEGLYKSGQIFCTQCEAEGFRRITYYLDRPDVMASFKTKLIANKEDFPVLLSNGNKINSGDLDNGLHFATWKDPYKKPSYLFACVFGKLGLVSDNFTTKSGREVSLEIYVDPGNEDKCEHAMRSLKNSMKWDEEVFGLEYDLDIYMIVAVDSFNMGAMENKGLNVFNSAYVLAKQETATDKDFQGIEGVIGHEYFHNWTGNRVTCRDWFQLTLKEGLTVFRDQEFSSDMLDRSVKRIEDVKELRARQFNEDAGPLSHPIKPKSFVEINNFYTATVYEKGAEVIRMIHTLIGKENFRKGMDLYFERHDGQAVTTEDFVAAMSDASGADLEHFKVWYDQNGTPKINVSMDYNEETKSCEIKIEQVDLVLNNQNYDCLHMPFHMALYTLNGDKYDLQSDGKFELKNTIEILKFENINERPVLSLNRNFTAPINVEYDFRSEDLEILMSFDDDEFNRYDACQRLTEIEIKRLVEQSRTGKTLVISDQYLSAYKKLFLDDSLAPAFKAYALSLPSLSDINNKLEKFDFEHLPLAIDYLGQTIASELENELTSLVYALESKEGFSISPASMGKRSLKAYAITLLSKTKGPAALDLIYSQYLNANNMTDEIGALEALVRIENPYREKALSHFYAKWKNETLVMQKWLRAQATAKCITIDALMALANDPVFDEKIPNLVRALVGSFLWFNPTKLHEIDGSGYKFVADFIIKMDQLNPQIAAGLAKGLNFRKKLDSTREHLLKIQLVRIRDYKNLSSDTLEVVNKNLA